MKRFKILMAIILFAGIQTISAQSKLSIPGFGDIPLVQEGDLYSLDFGKLGKFNFSGTVKPLSLSTTVDMDDIGKFPVATVMRALGLRDITMTVKQKGLEIAANFDDKIKDDIADELKKIKPLAPIIGTIFNTLEIRESQAALLFDMDGNLGGRLDINVHVFGQRLPIPEKKGTLALDEIIKAIVKPIKDKGTGIIADVGKIISDAGGLAMSGINSGIGAVNKYAKLGAIKADHIHSADYCMKHCVPIRAEKMANEVHPRAMNAIVQFYTNIIEDLILIEGETTAETKQLREAMFLSEWIKLNQKIEQDWEEVKNDKEYVGYFLTQSDAEKGGRKYRELIQQGMQPFFNSRATLHKLMTEIKFMTNNTSAYIKNKQTKTHLNIEAGPITVSETQPGWLSGQWVFHRVWGTDYVRIKNFYKDTYLHIENGKVECSAIGDGALSSHWQLERIGGTEQYRIKNRWKGTYLDVVSGKMMCTSSSADKVSSQWEIKYNKVGSSENYTQNEYIASKGLSLLVSENRKYKLIFYNGLFMVQRFDGKTVWKATYADNATIVKNTANQKHRITIRDDARLDIYDANNKLLWTNNMVDFDIKTYTFFELKNEFKGTYINTEKGLASTDRVKGWLSSQWFFEPVDGTGYMRIRNRYTGGYLNVEFGSLQCGKAGPELHSAQWLVEKVPGKRSVRLVNRWKATYINVETGKLACTQAGMGWTSAMWEVQYVK